MSAAHGSPTRKPWPMKWVVLSIVVFIVLSTLVNLYYRKPGRAYRPYQDAQDRATTARLLNAGWSKIPLELREPVEKPGLGEIPAPVTRDAPGLGADLETKFAEHPKLLATIDHVVAPADVDHGSAYHVYFTATLPDQKFQLGELELFHRGNELVLVPTAESLPGHDLRTRWPDSTYRADFSTANLPAGRYHARIVAAGPAAAWSFTVR